jgi:hypothetical protein
VAEDALSVKLGVLDLGGILVVYGNKTTVVTERTEDAQRKKKRKFKVGLTCLLCFMLKLWKSQNSIIFFRLCEFSVNSVSLWWEFVSSMYNNHAMI